MEKAEKTQYQAALAITGTRQGSNRSKLDEEFGWETIPDRHWCRRIVQIHKIKNNMTQSYLRDNLPSLRGTFYRNNNPKGVSPLDAAITYSPTPLVRRII